MTKSPAFAPVSVTLLISMLPGPLFVTVMICAALVVLITWLPKSTADAWRVATALTPLPSSEAVCGAPAALEAKLAFADAGPSTEGLKLKSAEHHWFCNSTVVSQVLLESGKCAVSELAADVTSTGKAELLVNLSVFGALWTFTCWSPKSSEPGVRDTA